MINSKTLRHNILLQIPATIVTLGLMWLFPFFVHLLDVNGSQLGAKLLPIYYAPLLAAWFFHPSVAILCSLLMPFLNHTFTGMPNFETAIMLTIELVIFSLLILLLKKWRYLPIFMLLAVLLGKLGSSLLLFIFPIISIAPFTYFSTSVTTAVPGLIIILVINIILLKLPNEQ